jgi:glycosyltransferase involved in cell wall biosynthesis
MDPLPYDANARAELRARIAAPPDTVIVGIASRLIAPKGITYGLQAFARAADPFPTAQLVIIGDGDIRAELEAEARALNLSHRAHFLGWQPAAARLMAGFDVFLMPSLREGFGLALLEAMAARLPIVASSISAIPEVVVDGETGYLAPARDVESLVEHLSLLLSDADLRARMGAAGEARLREHFSVEGMAARTIDVYQRVLAARIASR